VEGYDPSTYGERFADVYDDWYGDVTDADACTRRIAALVDEVGGGPVLELGVGSGRLALPLAELGVEVHGIDASPAMVERLRAKPGGSAVQVTVGDMARLDLAGAPRFAVVMVAFNTFFNLGTETEQRRCLERVAASLIPAGRFVIEAFVPDDPSDDRTHRPEGSVVPRRIAGDEVVLAVTSINRSAQTISGSHVHLAAGGIRLRPWHLRYATPDQLDQLAADAGLVLDRRHAGWREEPFTADSSTHVSTYRLRAPG
jgi:SAM-dependent methyltransferase